jgi:hypothetical protein
LWHRTFTLLELLDGHDLFRFLQTSQVRQRGIAKRHSPPSTWGLEMPSRLAPACSSDNPPHPIATFQNDTIGAFADDAEHLVLVHSGDKCAAPAVFVRGFPYIHMILLNHSQGGLSVRYAQTKLSLWYGPPQLQDPEEAAAA